LFDRGLANLAVNPGDAESAFKGALAKFREVSRASPREPNHRINMGAAYQNLGLIAERANRFGDADQHYIRAISIFESLSVAPSTAKGVNQRLAAAEGLRALLLSTCPDPRVRNPVKAVELATHGSALDGSNPEVWVKLGLVDMNAVDPRGAI